MQNSNFRNRSREQVFIVRSGNKLASIYQMHDIALTFSGSLSCADIQYNYYSTGSSLKASGMFQTYYTLMRSESVLIHVLCTLFLGVLIWFSSEFLIMFVVFIFHCSRNIPGNNNKAPDSMTFQ